MCAEPEATKYVPGIGTTGTGAPRALYFGLSVRIGYRPMLLGRQIMTAITSMMIQISINTIIPQMTGQSGDRLVGYNCKTKFTLVACFVHVLILAFVKA